MDRQSLAILFGMVCSIVLTPLVAKIWQRLAPPKLDGAGDLSADAWRHGDALSNEALIVTALAGILFVGYEGFGTIVGGVEVVMVITGVFGIPTAWTLLRARIFGSRAALTDFTKYFERKHGTSFQSCLYVGIPAFVIFLACLVVSLSKRP